jgi:hypothetical protein
MTAVCHTIISIRIQVLDKSKISDYSLKHSPYLLFIFLRSILYTRRRGKLSRPFLPLPRLTSFCWRPNPDQLRTNHVKVGQCRHDSSLTLSVNSTSLPDTRQASSLAATFHGPCNMNSSPSHRPAYSSLVIPAAHGELLVPRNDWGGSPVCCLDVFEVMPQVISHPLIWH